MGRRQRHHALATDDWARHQGCLYVVDAATLDSPEWPVLLVDLRHERGRAFRATAAAVPAIENNLFIANMDVADYARSAHADGVFRGSS